MARCSVCAVVTVACTQGQTAETQPGPGGAARETAATFERPRPQFLRFNEDWSALAGVPAEARTDFFDPIKHVRLSADASFWASFGGSGRVRVENWRNFQFGSPEVSDDTFALSRVLLHGDFRLGERARVFLQGKSANATDRNLPGGRRDVDVDSLDIEQAFVDVHFNLGPSASVILRPGRQALQFGKQRLVSPLPWLNNLRRWDERYRARPAAKQVLTL